MECRKKTVLVMRKAGEGVLKATASYLITQKTELLVKQIKRLKKSDLEFLRKTSAEASVYISEYLSACRRIAEHSQNIAESML